MVDPCDPPNSITSQGLVNPTQYTITDATALPYTHLSFISDPVYCLIDYTYEITEFENSNAVQDSAITQDVDDPTKFSFFYDTDLSPLEETQTVTITATSNSIYGAV